MNHHRVKNTSDVSNYGLPFDLALPYTAFVTLASVTFMLALDQDKGQLAKIHNRPYSDCQPPF